MKVHPDGVRWFVCGIPILHEEMNHNDDYDAT
ncbi:hypothetical protein CCYS_02350 [Corynebacterium cystitidis DSM 20524]|nr:hypothetical protein CCYS_02350 [Corynebacterium cystitidis DSM 20524]SNV87365.1 Uncharacterised protein [Corynebacterium cystitidis]